MKEKVEELISITQMSLTSFQLLEEIGDTLKVGGVDKHNPDESDQLPATRGDKRYTQGRIPATRGDRGYTQGRIPATRGDRGYTQGRIPASRGDRRHT